MTSYARAACRISSKCEFLQCSRRGFNYCGWSITHSKPSLSLMRVIDQREDYCTKIPQYQHICKFSTDGINKNEPDSKPSLYQRFKLMYKEYWYVLLPVHLATSAMWLGGFYYLAISGVDIATLLEVAGGPDTWVQTIRGSKAGGIVTAYTMYKVATPARYTVTLGGTTLSINYLKKWGYIKPMPSKDALKEMYDKRRDELKEIYGQQKTAIKEKITSTKDEIKDEFVKTTSEFTSHMKEAKTGFKQTVTETKQEFKEGVREAADEWRHVGKLIKNNVKELVQQEKRAK